MTPHENNRILTKEDFCDYLHEAVHALGHLIQSWYAAFTSLMLTSDKEILDVTFAAWTHEHIGRYNCGKLDRH